jgi:hypothetical protein
MEMAASIKKADASLMRGKRAICIEQSGITGGARHRAAIGMCIDCSRLRVVCAHQASKQESVMIDGRVVGRNRIKGEKRCTDGVEDGRGQGRDDACIDVNVGETGFKVVVDVGVDISATDGIDLVAIGGRVVFVVVGNDKNTIVSINSVIARIGG